MKKYIFYFTLFTLDMIFDFANNVMYYRYIYVLQELSKMPQLKHPAAVVQVKSKNLIVMRINSDSEK